MNKILLNEKEFNFTENNFPILIHGEDKSGASFYTISIAVNLFLKNLPIVFLCGYPMAEEEFRKQVNQDYGKDRIIFYTKERISEFKEFVADQNNQERIIFIKNIELFDEDIFNLISSKNKIILSGDINKCSFKDKILNKKFNTKIFFSPFNDVKLPALQKYEGFLVSSNSEGVTKVKPI
jgi:hypothetical protein